MLPCTLSGFFIYLSHSVPELHGTYQFANVINESSLNSLIRKQNMLHVFIISLGKQDNRLHVFIASLPGDPVWQRPLCFRCLHLLPSGAERMLVHLCHVLNWSEMQTTIDFNYLFTTPVVTWEKLAMTNNHSKYKTSSLTTVLRYSIVIFTHTSIFLIFPQLHHILWKWWLW